MHSPHEPQQQVQRHDGQPEKHQVLGHVGQRELTGHDPLADHRPEVRDPGHRKDERRAVSREVEAVEDADARQENSQDVRDERDRKKHRRHDALRLSSRSERLKTVDSRPIRSG